MKPFLPFLFTLAMGIPNGEALGMEEGREQKNIMISYPVSHGQQATHLYKTWENGDKLLPGSYTIKGEIGLKNREHREISDVLDLKLPHENESGIPSSGAGWSRKKDTYTWNPGKTISPQPFLIEPAVKNFVINDYDELHIDFEEVDPDNPILTKLTMRVSGKKLEPDSATAMVESDGQQLVLLGSEDLSSISWREKDYRYLLKRILRLPSDLNWQYIAKSGNIFYQKRFQWQLSSLETIDIFFKANASQDQFNVFNCNLRLASDSLWMPTKIIPCGKFPQEIIRFKGRQGFRIWVGKLNRREPLSENYSILNEIIFISPQEILTEIEKQPIHSIRFQSLSNPRKDPPTALEMDETARVFRPHSTVKTLGPNRKRMILPINDLILKTGNNGRINSITLSIQPKYPDFSTGFRLQNIRAVGYKPVLRPAILDTGEQLGKRWGGPFFESKENGSEVDWLKVQAFSPFYTPGFQSRPLHKLSIPFSGDESRPKKQVASNRIPWRGLTIQSEKVFDRWQADGTGLWLEGKGNEIEIDWPRKTRVNDNTRIFFGIGEGHEDILDLSVIPVSDGKESAAISVSANAPETLKGAPKEIQALKIKLLLHNPPYRIQLKELAIFEPLQPNTSEVLDIPILFEEETPLAPQNIQSPFKREVRLFRGHLSAPVAIDKDQPLALSWDTPVGQIPARIQAIKISYKVPPTMHARNPCWLQFTLMSASRKISRSLCPEDSSDQIHLPAEKLFSEADFGSDEKIESITWKVLSKGIKNSGKKFWSMDIEASLMNYRIQTPRENLLLQPLIEWNGKILFPGYLFKVPAGDFFKKKFQANLGSFSLKDDSETSSTFRQLDPPHLQFEKTTLERMEPISPKEWASLTDAVPHTTEEQNPEWQIPWSSIFYLSLLMALFLWGKKSIGKFPWMKMLIALSPDTTGRQIRVWTSTAAVLYLLGFIFSLAKKQGTGDILLSLAPVAAVLAWRSFIFRIQPHLQKGWPRIAAYIYRGPGTQYITGFLSAMTMAAIFLTVGLEAIVEQFAVAGYFLLAVGVILAAWNLRQETETIEHQDSPPIPGNEVKGA